MVKKIKLLCFPYAGGSAMVYQKWRKYISDSIELCPIELAGRGKRFKEPLYQNFHELIEDMFNEIRHHLDGTYYAFYGHSLGSLVVYELLRHISYNSFYEPEHIFFSAHGSPFVEKTSIYQNIHKLPDSEFLDRIQKLGGTPDDLLKHPQFTEVFLKILRADFEVLNLYEPNFIKVNCPITVLGGKHDQTIDNKELLGWKEHASSDFKIYKLNGGHFFIQETIQEVTNIVNTRLINRINGGEPDDYKFSRIN